MSSPASESPRSALARSLLALLRGEAPVALAPAAGPNDERELDERATAGDRSAIARRRARAFQAALPGRVARALELEATAVVLADGSSLSLDDAERLLARKEERSAHLPLRRSLDAARRPVVHQLLQFEGYGSDELVGDPATKAALTAFLTTSRSLRDAAREALATLGGEPLEGPAALTRALDLPDASGAFGEAATTQLLAVARDAARPVQRVGRFRAPRLLSGTALVIDVSALSGSSGGREARFAQPPVILRHQRHARTLDAGCRALAAATAGATAAVSDDLLGRAMALGLASAPSRRAYGATRGDADRAARVGAACLVLEARAQAALALLARPEADAGAVVDAAREALIDAWGCDPGVALVEERLLGPWTFADVPDNPDDDDLAADPAAGTPSWLAAAGAAVALRDAFDESFPQRTDAWREGVALVVAVSAGVAEGASGGDEARAAQEKARRWTAGLSAWVADLL